MTIETVAIYIGYAILGILGLAILALAVFTIILVGVGIYRIVTTKTTIRFMQKPEAQATGAGLQAAYDLMIQKGCKEYWTLKEVHNHIEKFHKLHNL